MCAGNENGEIEDGSFLLPRPFRSSLHASKRCWSRALRVSISLNTFTQYPSFFSILTLCFFNGLKVLEWSKPNMRLILFGSLSCVCRSLFFLFDVKMRVCDWEKEEELKIFLCSRRSHFLLVTHSLLGGSPGEGDAED